MKLTWLLAPSLLLVACSGEEASVSASGSQGPAPASVSAPTTGEVSEASVDDVARMSLDMIDEVTGILRGVTDVESAKQAAKSLEAVSRRVLPLRERRTELSDAGAEAQNKIQFAGDTMAMLRAAAELGGEFTRIEDISGARQVLEGPMSELLEFFNSRD